ILDRLVHNAHRLDMHGNPCAKSATARRPEPKREVLRSKSRESAVPGRSWRKIFMSKFQILAENEKKSRRRESRGGDERTVRVAALRAQRDEERRGNDAPWKAWKTQKASFPLFPPGFEFRPTTKATDVHLSNSPAAAYN